MKTLLVFCTIALAVNALPAGFFSSEEDSDEVHPLFLLPSFSRRSFVPDTVTVDVGSDDSSDEDDGFRAVYRPFFINPFSIFHRPSIFESFPSSDSLGEKANTTSTTRVINGHKVVQNDTMYEKDGAVFHFKTIVIMPEEDSDETTSVPVEDATEVDTTKADKNSQDNEINKEELDVNWRSAEHNGDVEVFTNERDMAREKYIDLTNDIRVNGMLADQMQQKMIQMPKDVELLPQDRQQSSQQPGMVYDVHSPADYQTNDFQNPDWQIN